MEKDFNYQDPDWQQALARHLQKVHGHGPQRCAAIARLTAGLLTQMQHDEAQFCFIKEDGSLRFARGTLSRDVASAFDGYQFKTDPDRLRRDNRNTRGTYTYWDLDKHAFRSFRCIDLNVTTILVTSVTP